MGLRVELPDPNVPRTWAQQMGLEKLSETTFRSTAGAPFGGNFRNHNGEMRPRAFGGHVYAQSLYAASKTVPTGFVIHVRNHHCCNILSHEI
jgi:acyl-CoA thioesterase